MSLRHCLALVFCVVLALPAAAQDHYRLKAEFSIKEVLEEEGSQLIMGTVYYDKYVQKVVYDVTFPEPRTYVMKDTNLVVVEGGEVIEVNRIPPLSQYTFFHLLLEQQLKTFGLDQPNSGFNLEDATREEDMVINTYEPLDQMKKVFGNVIISLKGQRLHGVAIMDGEDQLLNRQIFRKYKMHDGLLVPTEVVYFNYLEDGRVHKKITTFKNVKINDPNEDSKYNYPVDHY
jgi:hypothetical protein